MSTKTSELNAALKRIEPARDYNLSQIRDEGIFPWTRYVKTIRRIVQLDRANENVLKASITGESRGLEYKIKGRNISKFLEKYGPGFMLTALEK